MRKLLLALLLLLCVPVGLVHAQSQIWIYGQVTSAPTQVTYVVPCLQFTFSVSDSQQADLVGTTLTVVVPFNIGNETLNSYYNFSGYGSSGSSGIPSGYFVVETVNAGSGSAPDWLTAIFQQVWSYATMIGGFIVAYVNSMVAPSGIPSYAVSLGLLAFVLVAMVFAARKLPWYFAAILIFLGIAVASNLISSLM